MEGGQKVDINLESPLDTKSSDMLVSVNEIKFAHNRQKYQGHVLPTSLRYERDGWAAGWYVYNFEIGGGYIFSTNETDEGYNNKAQWLAARRTKMNDTPTYVMDFHIANFDTDDTAEHTRANIKQDANAVNQAIQFRAWYTAAPSINARECKEVTINHDVNPLISVNYAVDDVDYKAKFRFNYDAAKPAQTSFTKITETGWNANLSMEYLGHDDEGTVTARLTNNELSWVEDVELSIPKDLSYNNDVFAKFENVSGNQITWRVGQGKLVYQNNNHTFFYYTNYNDATANKTQVVSSTYASQFYYAPTIQVSIPFSYTVPLHKYYYKCTNAVWEIQGSKTIFEEEDQDDPSNWFDLDISYISHESTIYDGQIASVGLDGPDFITNATLIIDFEQFNNSSYDYTNVFSNTAYSSKVIDFVKNTNACTVPVLTGEVSGFVMPGETIERDVIIQAYYKYPGRTNPGANYDIDVYPYAFVGVNGSPNSFRLMPMSYPNVTMGVNAVGNDDSNVPEYIAVNQTYYKNDSLRYYLDGTYHNDTESNTPPTMSVAQLRAAINEGRTYLSQRPIVGRRTNLTANINRIDGRECDINIDFTSINTNLAVLGQKDCPSGTQYIQLSSNDSIDSTEFTNYTRPSIPSRYTDDNAPGNLQCIGILSFGLFEGDDEEDDYITNDPDNAIAGYYSIGTKKYNRLRTCKHYIKLGSQTYTIYDPSDVPDLDDVESINIDGNRMVVLYIGLSKDSQGSSFYVYSQFVQKVKKVLNEDQTAVVDVTYSSGDIVNTGLTISRLKISGDFGSELINVSEIEPCGLYLHDKKTDSDSGYRLGYRVNNGSGNSVNGGKIFIPFESLRASVLDYITHSAGFTSYSNETLPSNAVTIEHGAWNIPATSVAWYKRSILRTNLSNSSVNSNNNNLLRELHFKVAYPEYEVQSVQQGNTSTYNKEWVARYANANLSITTNVTSIGTVEINIGSYIYDTPPLDILGFVHSYNSLYHTYNYITPGTGPNGTEVTINYGNATLFSNGILFCVGKDNARQDVHLSYTSTSNKLNKSSWFVHGLDIINFMTHAKNVNNVSANIFGSHISGNSTATSVKIYSKERLMLDGDITYIGTVMAQSITKMALYYGALKLQFNNMSNFGNGSSVVELYTPQVADYVLTKPGVNSYAEITSTNGFVFDIIDKSTGELLLNHETAVIQLASSSLKVYLDEGSIYRGTLIYSNATAGARNLNLTNELGASNIRLVQQLNTYGLAFFPVQKEVNALSGSVYSAKYYGVSEGIAIFDTALKSNATGDTYSRYSVMMLSPINKYRVPLVIDSDNAKLIMYTQKAFTHAIGFDLTKIKKHVLSNGTTYYNFLDDTCTDLEMITVGPRSSIYTAAGYDVETSNKLYLNTSLLEPAAISYYNEQLHITYQPRSGNGIMVAGVLKELSASNLSIKQTVDLHAIYLPEYDTPTANKFNLYTADTDNVPKLTKSKLVLNKINDVKYYYATVFTESIDFNNALPTVTLISKEYKSNLNNATSITLSKSFSVSYNGKVDFVNNSAVQSHVDKEYSNVTQIVYHSDLTELDTLHLPGMPEMTLHDISLNADVTYTSGNNSIVYDYLSDKVTDMTINNKKVNTASVTLVDINNDNIGVAKYTININQALNTLVHFKHVGIYKVDYKEFSDNTAELDSIVFSDGEYKFNVIKLLDTGAALSTAIRYNTPKAYSFNFGHFSDPSETTPKFLDYTATDVRDPDPVTQTKHFARVLASDEYQLIKQQWESTVEVENFWWVDSESILVLTKDKIILRKKGKLTEDAPDYDDWMGDNWYDAHVFNRTYYLTSDADTMLCSSATGKNVHSYLYTLCVETMHSIKVSVYDPTTVSNNKMHCQREYTIEFKHIALGQQLNDLMDIAESFEANTSGCTVRTYSDIIASSLLTDSKITAVEVNGYHWLGIQYDRNFNQWSFGISIDTADKCKFIHGYGCVGINGYATGGMIPAEYFGLPELPEGVTLNTVPQITGFTSTVLDVKNLEKSEDVTVESLSEFNLFNTRIVGDENQQWYICKKLKDIVMSVSLTDITKTVKLPITNTYAQVYSSPSYAKYTVHALGIQIKQLLDLLTGESKDNALWKEVIKAAMFPLVWYLSPYTNVINYLQQTLGQYAYVHYNSTSIGRRGSVDHNTVDDNNAGLSESDISKSYMNTLISDDLSFDVQHITQEQSFKDNGWENVLGILASMVVSATDYAMQGLTVNQLQNQSAVSDIGRKFSQAFLQNVGSMSVTGFNMQSTKPMLKSEVTAVKTLDMFYSTSAQQNCYAGPGFVNMQFVAQCTAQSVTSVQLEAQQTQMFVLLRQLTTWQGKLSLLLLDMLKDFLFKSADVVSPNIAGTMPGVIAGLGWIAATVLAALGYATVAAQALLKMGIETVDEMLDSFFPNGIQTNVTAQLSRHNYDIEGKHAYGNKSETFMWPCVDCNAKLYTDESVDATLQDKSWPLEMPKATFGNSSTKTIYENQPTCITVKPAIMNNSDWDGEVPYSIAMCKGKQQHRALPNDTAYVIGTESFMPTVPFKNENIGEGEPVFTPPPVQDYQLNKDWNIFVTAMAGDALWVSCKDTKLFDGNYSNIVISNDFCGIAAPHIAVEVKRNICEEYLRPWAVSPDAIALNITGLNCAYEECAYHAFDGYGYRITDWLGSSGMNKEHYTQQYCFQINDRFKRSNKLPPNQFMGNFQAVPSMSLRVHDKVFNDIQVTTEGRGLRTGVTGENKDTQRYALPIFTEQISSLPAIVRALSPYKLAVIDGITSLTTDVRISQSSYKLPISVDFNINDKIYRMTNEYICSVEHEKGLEVVKYLVPALGLTYLGATPFMAYFYNQATRQYYIYQGGNTLQVMDMLERFRDIKSGTYDFINQEIVMPCLATMSRLDSKVKDDADETDNIVIPVFRHNKVGGEITPPTEMIFNTRSWYRTVSTPAGLVFQGPNRCIINRFVWSQYMLEDIKNNKGKWIKVPREEYHPFRDYGDIHRYNNILKLSKSNIKGWTHNPFLLVTSPIGVNEETDCKFEWEITFAWTVEMEQIYADKEYVTVNVMAETMMPGGKKFSRPTHIYLHKELFTRTGNVGYYSFRYQSTNGAGNRERLHIWSDGYIAVSSLQLEYKIVTEKRNEMLITQEDLKGMKEM